MNQLQQIFYCKVGKVCYDASGNIYHVKTSNRWEHINIGNKKIGISTLPVKLKIFNFDDFVFAYVFGGLCQTHPCPAMGYFVQQKMTKRKISIGSFVKNNLPDYKRN
jgi:hypothetical protein